MIKKLICLSFLIIIPFSLSLAQNKTKKASIQFDSMTVDLGTFPNSKSVQTAIYNFKNVGNDKLVFYDGGGDCGCITVEYPQKPIKPGKKGKIIVTYDGSNKGHSKFNHKIYFAVSGNPSHFILRLTGEMTKN